jgi:5-methylcytosine-specific restriction endonuclease McrA
MYKDSRWIKKREVILRMDKYLCRECSRYGKRKQANTVHHVIPVQERPDLKYENENLLSLCDKCHNKMHDRVTNKLTQTGLYWVRKLISPPPSSI